MTEMRKRHVVVRLFAAAVAGKYRLDIGCFDASEVASAPAGVLLVDVKDALHQQNVLTTAAKKLIFMAAERIGGPYATIFASLKAVSADRLEKLGCMVISRDADTLVGDFLYIISCSSLCWLDFLKENGPVGATCLMFSTGPFDQRRVDDLFDSQTCSRKWLEIDSLASRNLPPGIVGIIKTNQHDAPLGLSIYFDELSSMNQVRSDLESLGAVFTMEEPMWRWAHGHSSLLVSSVL